MNQNYYAYQSDDMMSCLTTGVGTPQIGMGGGVMRPMTENEKAFFKKIGVLK